MSDTQEPPMTVKFSTNVEDSVWFVKDIESVVRPEARKMLEEYARIPPDQVIEHIERARWRAWEYGPFASVGGLTWLNSYLKLHISHDKVLERVKNGASILDCGCFFAPDLRFLAYEGAPTDNMYGFDKAPEFFDIAYDFYNDRDRFHATLFAADGTVDFDQSRLAELKGKLDIIWSAKFLHLFDRGRHVEIAARLIKLLKPQPGSMFVGSQNGFPEPVEVPIAPDSFGRFQTTVYMGNADSIKEVWNEVAAKTGTKWSVESTLLDLRNIGLHKDDGTEYRRRTGYNLQWTATLLEPANW